MKFLYVFFLLPGFLSAGRPRIVEKAFEEEVEFRRETCSQIENILSYLRFNSADKDLINAQVTQQIKTDSKLIQKIHQRVAHNRAATWSCRTNKLSLIIDKTKDFFARYGRALLSGKLPEVMQGYWDRPRWMDKSNFEELAFKASLVLLLSKLNQTISLDDSAILHSTPLPVNLGLNLERLTFFYNQTDSPVGGELTFVHGGYAFGGQRQDKRYYRYGPFGKRFGPQDCSSWISKLIGANQAFSTIDFAEYKDAQLRKLVHPVSGRFLEEIEPGMIWVTRGKNGGHVNLVVQVNLKTRSVQVLEYARNLPDYEGFGFRNIAWDIRDPSVQNYWFELTSIEAEL